MARHLDVYLYRHLVGELTQADQGEMAFQYTEDWINRESAAPLSQSLPLTARPFTRNECVGFFNGILPEGSTRESIARNLGISARNDFAMLEEIGGECAGAVSFIPRGESLPTGSVKYHKLTEAELAERLRSLPRRPLMAGESHIRLSLAGAQDKLPVHAAGGVISIPLDGSPSTHILKLATGEFETIIVNELLCMRLAAAIGLRTAVVELGRAEDIEYLLVSRYDRIQDELHSLTRLHQEDFCQALGLVSDRKYQAEGGPSIARCVQLLRAACTAPAPDILRFIDAVIFNYLIGNNDAHGKNFSLLYKGVPTPPLTTEFAPLYDLVSTSYYPELSPRMAMKIGSEYLAERVYPRHFADLAEEAQLGKPFLKRRVRALAGLILDRLYLVFSEHPAGSGIAAHIQQRCERIAGLGWR